MVFCFLFFVFFRTQDGFLTLVIPMIRFTGGLPVLVHSRRSPPEEDASPSGGTLAPGLDDDRGALWDLRIKVNLHGGSPPRRRGVTGDGSSERRDNGVAGHEEDGDLERALV